MSPEKLYIQSLYMKYVGTADWVYFKFVKRQGPNLFAPFPKVFRFYVSLYIYCDAGVIGARYGKWCKSGFTTLHTDRDHLAVRRAIIIITTIIITIVIITAVITFILMLVISSNKLRATILIVLIKKNLRHLLIDIHWGDHSVQDGHPPMSNQSSNQDSYQQHLQD